VSGAENNGRLDSWFMPSWVEGLGYFDTTNHAKRIRGKVKIYAGLGDYVCPPSGEIVLYNSIKSPVTLSFRQGRTHGYEMKDGELFTLEKNAQ
jgi:cephalosporin-C deacetylase-like acetyl esterase